MIKIPTFEKIFLPTILLLIFFLNSQIRFLDNSYINYHDEIVHANVAVNSIGWSLIPKLRPEAIFPVDIKNWDFNYIWLHIGPFSFIVSGIFFKIFNNTDISVLRTTSLIFFDLTVILTYYLGTYLFNSKIKGFLGSVILLTNPFSYLLVSGIQFGDITDIILQFVNTFSFFMFLLYFKKKKFKFFIFGVIATIFGFYTKYALGLIPFISFLLISIFKDIYDKTFEFKKYLTYLFFFFLFLTPYTVYLLITARQEFIYEVFLVQLFHISTNFEGWARPWDTQLSVYLKLIYTPILLPLLLLLLIKGVKNFLNIKKHLFNSATMFPSVNILFLYLIISISIAKAPAFGYSVTPIVMLLIADFIYSIKDWKLSIAILLNVIFYNYLFKINILALDYDIYHLNQIDYNSDLYSNIHWPVIDPNLFGGLIVRNESMILQALLIVFIYLILKFFINPFINSLRIKAGYKDLIKFLNLCLISILLFVNFNLSAPIFSFSHNNQLMKSLGSAIKKDFPSSKVVFFVPSVVDALNLMFWSRKNFYDISFLTQSNKQIISNYKEKGYMFYILNDQNSNERINNLDNNCLPYYHSSICRL